jgi:hypothetical protein
MKPWYQSDVALEEPLQGVVGILAQNVETTSIVIVDNIVRAV